MEWLVTIEKKSYLCQLPRSLVAGHFNQIKVEDQNFLARWDRFHQCLVVKKQGSRLEHIVRVSSLHVSLSPFNQTKMASFTMVGANQACLEAHLNPSSRSKMLESKDKKHVEQHQYAPLTGKVTKLFVTQGNVLKRGEEVAIIEAMKMENRIIAECDGMVKSLHLKEKQNIHMGEKMFSTLPVEVDV